MEGKLGRRIGKIGAGAAGLALAFAAGAELTPNQTAQAKPRVTIDAVETDFVPTAVRRISCKRNESTWYPLVEGERIILRTKGAVVPADVSLDGKAQFDSDADTATTFAMWSPDGKDIFIVDVNYPGALKVLECNATRTSLENATGEEVITSDVRLGRNNPERRVNFNFVSK